MCTRTPTHRREAVSHESCVFPYSDSCVSMQQHTPLFQHNTSSLGTHKRALMLAARVMPRRDASLRRLQTMTYLLAQAHCLHMSCRAVTHIANSHASLPTLPTHVTCPCACVCACACLCACLCACYCAPLSAWGSGVGNEIDTSCNEIHTLDEAARGFAVILRAVVALALVCNTIFAICMQDDGHTI